ncbi:hypothetical protein FKN04_12925 [Bacillus glycinifermentans]|uniref:hypothetical protein n=1 Tax=Bacillus TaxID=1386 RepID=UPI00158378B5|nr:MULTISPECIES: hypothetical protein [Bacillus]NUJ17479.1 hypothetical protein [Bacillus glycinifermentans]GIN67058.1 hypothetical protein J41TS2_24790 [Bacillus sonorensis]
MTIEVLKHEKNRSGYFLKHKALVKVTNLADENELVVKTSVKVGYHPMAYGLYGFNVRETVKEDQYMITWETGISAD